MTRVAILSDTHNHVINLMRAIQIIKQHKIDTLIHCGDLTTLDTAALLNEFRVILTFGNGDFASGAIQEYLRGLNNGSFAGMHFESELSGHRIAVAHGHVPGKIVEWIGEQRFEYIFHGHSHLCRDERKGISRIINPGALGGLKKGPRTFGILNFENSELKIFPVE